LSLTRAGWVDVLKSTFERFLADDCMGLAHQVAYSALLAFFPAVVALVGLLDLVNAYSALQSFLDPVAPKAVTQLIDTFRRDTSHGGSIVALVLGLGAATWAASGAMSAVVKAVNRAYEIEETRPFWRVRLIAIGLVICTAIVTAGTLILVVLGGSIGDGIARKANAGDAFAWVWNVARWPIAFAAVFLLFRLIYYFAPNQRRDWRWTSPGALLGAALWLALSGLFALYTSFSDSYSKTYGTLAGGIVLLLWLNYTSWAVLLGAELDSELERRIEG
jgi:membrane protein